MKKIITRLTALFLAIIMMSASLAICTFADEEESTEPETPATIWYGDSVTAEIAAGKNGYTFRSVYQKPHHAYEMSNHMVSVDGSAHDIPQLLILVPAEEDYTWTPDGIYEFGKSNYEILYCCDAETGYNDSVYYKRLNLEDSDYYDTESAAHIRAIVTNSYPYVSLDQMIANLKEAGFDGADELTRAEIITAVQSAIWAYANVSVGQYYYSRTFDVPSNSQWGGVMHDYTNEMNVWWNTGKRVFSTDETVQARINSLIDYLKSLDKVYSEKEQVIISDIDVLGFAPVIAKDGVFTVALQVALNNSGSSSLDDIKLSVYVDDQQVVTEKVILGTNNYEFTVEAKAGQTVKAVVSGKQTLPEGVYFYEPEGGREVSQCVVGVAAGETEVYSEASITPELPEEDPVTADLKLHKVNQRGENVSGAVFTLFSTVDGVEYTVGEYPVDENGYLTVTDLVPGSYELIETTVPEGFVTPEQSILFTIDDEGALTLTDNPLAKLDNEGVIVVENEFTPTKITLSGIKFLDDEEAKDSFSFTISYGGEIIKTVMNGIDGIFDFGEFAYDTEGKYVYTVTEVIGNDTLITYDESEYTVIVNVIEIDRVLHAEVTVLKDGEAHEGDIRFDNYTNPDIPDNPPPYNPPPATGDSTALFALLAALSIGVCAIVFFRKRRTV